MAGSQRFGYGRNLTNWFCTTNRSAATVGFVEDEDEVEVAVAEASSAVVDMRRSAARRAPTLTLAGWKREKPKLCEACGRARRSAAARHFHMMERKNERKEDAGCWLTRITSAL